MLGEELRDGRQGPSVDLLAALVDLVLLLGLPELVDPAQAVVGGEDLGRQARQQPLQGEPVVDRGNSTSRSTSSMRKISGNIRLA